MRSGDDWFTDRIKSFGFDESLFFFLITKWFLSIKWLSKITFFTKLKNWSLFQLFDLYSQKGHEDEFIDIGNYIEIIYWNQDIVGWVNLTTVGGPLFCNFRTRESYKIRGPWGGWNWGIFGVEMRGFWCGTEGLWDWKGVVLVWNWCFELRGSVLNWGVLGS